MLTNALLNTIKINPARLELVRENHQSKVHVRSKNHQYTIPTPQVQVQSTDLDKYMYSHETDRCARCKKLKNFRRGLIHLVVSSRVPLGLSIIRCSDLVQF